MIAYRWVTQLVGLLMELGACTLYAVPLYSNELRQAASLTQAQVGVIFSAGDFGLFFGAVNGWIFDKAGPRVSSLTVLVTLAGGYAVMLGVLHGVVPSHPWELLVLIYFIIGQGSNMTNCVAITTNVRNFLPKDKGKVVGTLKMNFGLGLILYSLLYKYWLTTTEHFFFFVIVFTPALAILGVIFMKIVEREPEAKVPSPPSRAGSEVALVTSPSRKSQMLLAEGGVGSLDHIGSPEHVRKHSSSSVHGPPSGSSRVSGRMAHVTGPASTGPRSTSADAAERRDVVGVLVATRSQVKLQHGGSSSGPLVGSARSFKMNHPEPLRRRSSLMLHDGAGDADVAALDKGKADAMDIHGSVLNCNPEFWVLWCTYGVAQGAALLIINNLASALLAVGGTCKGDNTHVSNESFLAVLLLGIANSLGRLLTGLLADVIGDRHTPLVFCIILLCLSATCLAIVFAHTMVAVVALATVAALWFGAANTLSAVMLAQLFGTAHYGSNLGKFTTAPGVFAITFNAVGGQLYDSRTNCYSGGVHKCFGDDCYTSTFYFAFGVCIVSTIVASLALMDWSVYFDVSPGGVSRVRKREEARLKAVGDGARERLLNHSTHANSAGLAFGDDDHGNADTYTAPSGGQRTAEV